MSNGSDDQRTAATGGNVGQAPYVILFLALLGVLVPRSIAPTGSAPGPSSTAGTPSTQPMGGGKELSAADRLERMIGEALGVTSLTAAETDAPSGAISTAWPGLPHHIWQAAPLVVVTDAAAASDWQRLAERVRSLRRRVYDVTRKSVKPGFLIATVHDPVDSHLQTYFDSDLASMQRAIQSYGFVLHRYWLPWQDWIHQARDPKLFTYSGRRPYEQDPGVLLYLRASPADPSLPDVLVLFLVGETPTGGTHVEALTNTLDIVTAWGRHEIRIIGPCASGTCFSLNQTLTSWHRVRVADLKRAGIKTLNIHFVTGSATNSSALSELSFSRSSDGSQLIADLQATVLPDSVASHFMFAHLNETRGIPLHKIALLTEADTTYGQLDIDRADGSDDQSAIDSSVLRLPYAMEIATVRNEYEKVDALKFGPQQPSGAPRMNLEVPWEQPRDARDIVPQFSDATPAVTERRLAVMLGALARRDVRAIGLMGTDPKDVLFLGQQIRRFCPNVQLFTLEANVLYTHPDYVKYFKGTMVGSTYPLFFNNREWSRLSLRRRDDLFSSSVSQGVHNAMLAQLERLYADVAGGPRIRMREYAMPFDRDSYGSPPLWLSIVGQNSLSPVAAIPRPNYKDHLDGVRPYEPLRLPAAPSNAPMKGLLGLPPFTIGSIVVSGIVFALAAAFLHQNLLRPACADLRSLRLPRLLPSLSIRNARVSLSNQNATIEYEPDAQRCAYAVVLFLGLAAVQLFATIVVLQSARLPESLYESHFGVAIVRGIDLAAILVCLVVVVSIPFLSLRHDGQAQPGGNSDGRSRIALACLVAPLLIGLAVSPFLPLVDGGVVARAIRVERWGDFFNGLTPVIPLTCMATIPVLWALCQLRRKYFLNLHRIGEPFFQDAVMGLAKRVSELDDKFSSRWWRPAETRDWILLSGLVVGLVLLYLRWINTADSPLLDRMMLIFGMLNVALIYTLHVRFMAVSGLLERFLRRLAQTALADAFEKVPTRLKRKAAGQIFAAGPHPGDLDIVIRQFEQVVRLRPDWETQVKGLCNEARERFQVMDQWARGERTAVYQAMEAVNRPLRAGCREVSRRLFLNARNEAMRRQPAAAAASSEASWEQAARVFVATQIATLLRQAFAHIQNLLIYLMLMLLMLLWAVYSYPFQPQRFISLCLIGLTLWMIVSTVYVFIRFNRNEILSYLADTSPNRFTPDRSLFRQVFVFAVIPLLSLLAFQFPEVGNVLFFWVDGLQKAFR